MDASKLANVSDATIKGAAIRDLVKGAVGGCNQVASLRMAANVVDQEIITLGTDVFEFNVVATDTTHNIGEVVAGEMATGVVANTLTLVNAKATSIAVGDVLLCQAEYMLVTGKSIGAANTALTVRRGYAGSTAATHANAQQLDEAVQSVAAGRIAVPITGTLTPTAVTPLLVKAVNAEGSAAQGVTATQISVNSVVLSRAADGTQTTCSEGMTGGNNVIDAKFRGGVQPGKSTMSVVSRVPTATEVTLGTMSFVFPFSVTTAQVYAVTTSTGATIAINGAIARSGAVVTINNAGDTDWAVTSTVTCVASGNLGDAA